MTKISPIIVFYVCFLVPDAVSSMSISEVYSDGFLVSWSRPTQVNGQLVAYVVKCWQNDSKSSTMKIYRTLHSILAFVTTGLKPRTLYTLTVAAETQAGKGSAKMLNVKTVDSPGITLFLYTRYRCRINHFIIIQ